MTKSNLDIFSYTAYRPYLLDRLAEMKKQDSKYSLRFISNKLGLSSKSHLKMVADGAHNISISLTRKLADLFELKPTEKDFFLSLVRFEQAKTDEDKREALEALRTSKRFARMHQLELDQLEYYGDPLMLVLREMVDLQGFEENAKWIMPRLPFKTTAAKIRKAIARLERLDLLVRDEKGVLKQADMHISSGEGFISIAMKDFYRQKFDLAAGSLELPGDVRQVGGITMGLSREAYEKITVLFMDFINSVRAVADEDDQLEEVYQLVMGLYPLTRPLKPGPKSGV